MAYNTLETTLGAWSYIFLIVVILSAFFIHQFAKVFIANIISVDSVKTGIPIKRFIEPIGLILMIIFGVGWSNGPEINALYFTDRKKNTLQVYLGAILTNIVVGIVFIILSSYFISNAKLFNISVMQINIISFFAMFGNVNLAVGIMNLIPMIPFSGYHVLYELVSPNSKMWLINNKNIVQIIFMLLIVFGYVSLVIYNLINFIQQFIITLW